MKLYKRLFLFFTLVGIMSCETLDLDLQENPDVLNLESADVDLVFNNVQFTFRNQMNGLGNLSDGPMRMINFFGTYNPGQGTMNGTWSATYNFGTNLQALETFADRDGFNVHYGIGLIMQATMYVNLVDYIGKAVFSEANNVEFPNPGLDSGEEIYAGAFQMIDDGIARINQGGRAPATDLFYGGDVQKWVAYANTLKLRMHLQTRLVSPAESTQGINAVISGGNFIDVSSEDLQFQYGTNPNPIESRHPIFTGNYINGAGGYMSNGLMSYMKDSMSVADPRMRYYFYRQSDRTAADLIANDIVRCAGNPAYDFCTIGDFYYGRDHTDNEGIPADGNIRTTYGLYPGGGAFDDGALIAASQTTAVGDGIAPLHLSSWTHFMLGEAALTLGTAGTPETYLETGMRQALQKVRAFSPGNMTAGQIDDYVTEVLAEYALASNAEKLDIMIREWYLASFPNGMLAYNTYRRTGLPTFLQDPIINAGAFVRNYFLPESELNSNTNPDFANQITITDKVFWDNNPDGFIN